jgi:major outer membrane protein
MKKIKWMICLALLSFKTMDALPVGNPADASLLCKGILCDEPCGSCWDAFSFRSGFYGDYVFNRHLKLIQTGSQIDRSHIYTNAGYFALNGWNRIDFFTTLGMTKFFLDGAASSFGNREQPGALFKVQTSSSFAWSVGGRATLLQCGCTSLGIEGQYAITNPLVRIVTRANTRTEGDRIPFHYREWQVGLGVSHRIHNLVPYIAAKYSRARIQVQPEMMNGPNLIILESKKKWGYEVGCSLINCERLSLTVAGRFGDEKACHINGQIRF